MAKITSQLKKLVAANNVKETGKIVYKHVSRSKPCLATVNITKKEPISIIIGNIIENKQSSVKISPKISLKLNLKSAKINSSTKTIITKTNNITKR